MPSSYKVAPRYLKLVTAIYSISAMMLFMLLVMILLFSVLAPIPYVYHCSVFESVGEVLKFTTAAAHKVDVVGKS